MEGPPVLGPEAYMWVTGGGTTVIPMYGWGAGNRADDIDRPDTRFPTEGCPSSPGGLVDKGLAAPGGGGPGDKGEE